MPSIQSYSHLFKTSVTGTTVNGTPLPLPVGLLEKMVREASSSNLAAIGPIDNIFFAYPFQNPAIIFSAKGGETLVKLANEPRLARFVEAIVLEGDEETPDCTQMTDVGLQFQETMSNMHQFPSLSTLRVAFKPISSEDRPPPPRPFPIPLPRFHRQTSKPAASSSIVGYRQPFPYYDPQCRWTWGG
ncbi:hypothetical protein JAAARDRAFT_197158 [Jaapia argillacea MUCL 33604]|uniref:Uncharacterized protein n=1 Tax=Jaapia argillacea MUCL 33604 TaxID=933084 RepID=A0A067PTN2_9AGAM|nr:hypothetical protein JAAARDRAFT_197158 [Jaapia argillacea MUCL 33604]